MANERVHTFTISVTFDKKCSQSVALREIRDNIHGEFYTYQAEDNEPGSFRVKSIKPCTKS